VKCEQVRTMIEDLHYGELEEPQAAEVTAHLRDCPKCASELAMLEREARLYEAYAAKTESALEPPPDLWKRALDSPGTGLRPVASDNRPVSRTRWLSALVPASSWVGQAVAAILLVAISITCTLIVGEHYRAKRVASLQETSTTAGASEEKSLETALKSIQRAEQEYLTAIRELSAIAEKQKSSLDPRVVAELQASLKLIDEHIAATRKAYYAHPKDAELALYMLAAYSRKVELLQDLTS
jgi:anti-sigma factor RsiW